MRVRACVRVCACALISRSLRACMCVCVCVCMCTCARVLRSVRVHAHSAYAMRMRYAYACNVYGGVSRMAVACGGSRMAVACGVVRADLRALRVADAAVHEVAVPRHGVQDAVRHGGGCRGMSAGIVRVAEASRHRSGACCACDE